MNVKLLEKVKARILKNAGKRFNMRYWGISCKGETLTDQIGKPPCGTQACLAGETVLAAGIARIDRKNGGLVMKSGDGGHSIKWHAQQALGLGYDQSENLFMFKAWSSRPFRGWPEQFETDYRNARTSAQRAKVAAKRIDYFIRTGH